MQQWLYVFRHVGLGFRESPFATEPATGQVAQVAFGCDAVGAGSGIYRSLAYRISKSATVAVEFGDARRIKPMCAMQKKGKGFPWLVLFQSQYREFACGHRRTTSIGQ